MTTTNERSDAAPSRLAYFLTVQAVVVGVIVALGAYRTHVIHVQQQLPTLRETPLTVGPLYDYPAVVSDEQLQRVLLKLRPRLDGTKTVLGHVDHALRCWGADIDFQDPKFISGAEIRQLLTDHQRFAELYGADKPALLIDKDRGVAVRTQEGFCTCSHTDHTLASLAEIGTPLDFPIVTPGRTATFRDMVEQSLRDFSLNQAEYEWSAMTYALILPPTTQWITSEKQLVDFDLVANRIMRESLPRGVCMAQHRLYTLVIFLRVNEQFSILSDATRERTLQFLGDATKRLVAHQHEDGFWNDEWPYAAPLTREPTARDGDRLTERILATGHVMEWWAMAPEQVHPPRDRLVAAGQWLVQVIDGLSDAEVLRDYTYVSHVARALALWRKHEPFEVLRHVTPEPAATGKGHKQNEPEEKDEG
jgi:hypothetical protein